MPSTGYWMGISMNRWIILLLFPLLFVLPGCYSLPTEVPVVHTFQTVTPEIPTTAIVHGTIINGTDDAPISNGVILIQADKIIAVGNSQSVVIPANTTVIDAKSGFILPGFINTHVHGGYDLDRLNAWLKGGVTTIRDEGTRPSKSLTDWLAIRHEANGNPIYAHLISAGAMIGVPGGYGDLFVNSEVEAKQAVLEELQTGVDQIKVSLEDGYAGQHDLPKLTPQELKIIVETTHATNKRVSGHITQAAYIPIMLDAGVDDIAHLAWDPIPDETIAKMVKQGVYLIPTFTIFRNYNAPLEECVNNLRRYVQAGGKVALGNDFGGGPGDFESGIPMYEIEMMQTAGMTPKQIIQASTRNAAIVIGMEDRIGTLEEGKTADILILEGNPLEDLSMLKNISMVIHLGQVVKFSEE